MPNGKAREVFFEKKQIGNIVRITAIDAASGTEVIIQAPARTSQHDLQRMAYNKLNYVLRKAQNHESDKD